MAFEAQRRAVSCAASRVKTELKRDISAVFAAAGLLMLMLTAGPLLTYLLGLFAYPFSAAVSAVSGSEYDAVLASYRAFLTSDVFTGLFELACYTASMLVPFLFLKRFSFRRPRSYFPFAFRMPQKAFSFFAFACGMTLGVNFICNLLFERFYPAVQSSAPAGPVSAAVTVIMAAVVAPLAEELFFRGAVYGTLAPYSQPFAIFVSAFVFALAHRNPPQVINAFVLGVFLALAYAKTGSLAPCVFIHSFNNAFSLIVQYYAAHDMRGVFVIAIGAGVLALGVFTAVRLMIAAAKRRRILTRYDDAATDLPRLDKKALISALTRSTYSCGEIPDASAFCWIFNPCSSVPV